MENKKELSTEQREELISTLKTRFEKNMNRHTGVEWAKLQAKLDSDKSVEKLWSINEMERTGGNRMLLDLMPERANTSFMIVLLKVPKVAEAFVTTGKGSNQEKNLNLQITPLIWLLPWV